MYLLLYQVTVGKLSKITLAGLLAVIRVHYMATLSNWLTFAVHV